MPPKKNNDRDFYLDLGKFMQRINDLDGTISERADALEEMFLGLQKWQEKHQLSDNKEFSEIKDKIDQAKEEVMGLRKEVSALKLDQNLIIRTSSIVSGIMVFVLNGGYLLWRILRER